MKAKPMGMLLMMPAKWVNRHQQDVIAYLKEENKILRERLGTEIRRILRRWFATGRILTQDAKESALLTEKGRRSDGVHRMLQPQ